MSISDFLDKFDIGDRTSLPRQGLVLFTMSLLREVVLLEKDNTGSPGKAAIEYLLNQKYEVIEKREIPKNLQELFLKEIDSVINKVVAKYKIKRKGKNFYFDESLDSLSIVITAPDEVCDTEDQLIANLYAAQSELESLRIQLTRTNLQNTAQTILVKKAILDKEQEIEFMKKKLSTFHKFDSVTDQNILYRRSIGEAKKEIGTGAAIGAGIGYASASSNFKKKMKFKNKLKAFQQATKDLENSKKVNRGRGSEVKHLLNSSTPLSQNKANKVDKLKSQIRSEVENQKFLRKAVNNGEKKVMRLTREAIKRGIKGGAIGAGVGTAAGLGVYAAHKLANKSEVSLSNKLFAHLTKLGAFPLQEDSDDYRSYYKIGERTRGLYKGLNNFYRKNKVKGLKIASISGALLLGASGISYILKRVREKGPEKVKNSIRSTQYKARNSKTLTNSEKMTIQNNGNAAIQKIDQMFKKKK